MAKSKRKRIGKHQVTLSLCKHVRSWSGFYPEEVAEDKREQRVLRRLEELGTDLFRIVRRENVKYSSGDTAVRLYLEPYQEERIRLNIADEKRCPKNP